MAHCLGAGLPFFFFFFWIIVGFSFFTLKVSLRTSAYQTEKGDEQIPIKLTVAIPHPSSPSSHVSKQMRRNI